MLLFYIGRRAAAEQSENFAEKREKRKVWKRGRFIDVHHVMWRVMTEAWHHQDLKYRNTLRSSSSITALHTEISAADPTEMAA